MDNQGKIIIDTVRPLIQTSLGLIIEDGTVKILTIISTNQINITNG